MFQRRTQLENLPLLVVLGVSASLLIGVGWQTDAAGPVNPSLRPSVAERATAQVSSGDRLASCAERAMACTNAARLGVEARRAPQPERAEAFRVEASSSELAGANDELLADEAPGRDESSGHELLLVADARHVYRGEFGPDGAPIGRWEWIDARAQTRTEGASVAGRLDGLWREWHANGAAASASEFKLGVPDGAAAEWYENGALRQLGGFAGGERTGLWISWYASGQIRARGVYERGLRSGLWEEWHESGAVLLRATYAPGRAHGLWMSWYSNGQLKERGLFIDGRREGPWEFLDFDGGVDLRSGCYRSGRMVRDA